jgi:hypothetical protein
MPFFHWLAAGFGGRMMAMGRGGRMIGGAAAVLWAACGAAWPQTTLDALERSLKDVGKQHEQGEQTQRDDFARVLDAALASPEAALQAWSDAGGRVPEPPRLDPANEEWMRQALEACEAEGVASPELSGALADDAQARKRLFKRAGYYQEILAGYLHSRAAQAAWAHCQLLKFAADFSAKKTDPAKDPRWTSWLEGNVAGFERISGHPFCSVTVGASPLVRRYGQDQLLGKDFKEWSVQGMPELFRTWILDPARAARARDIGKTWDAYIVLNHAESGNPDKWENERLPWLLFQKQADEYRVAPDVMPLTRLVEIMKQHPAHPRFKEMQAITGELLADLKRRKG